MMYLSNTNPVTSGNVGHHGLMVSKQLVNDVVYVAICGKSKGMIHLSNGYRFICGNSIPSNGVPIASLGRQEAITIEGERQKCKRCYSQVTGEEAHKSRLMVGVQKLNPCNYPILFSAIYSANAERHPDFKRWASSGLPVFAGDEKYNRLQIDRLMSQTKFMTKRSMNFNVDIRTEKLPVYGGDEVIVRGDVLIDGSDLSVSELLNLFNIGDYGFPRTKLRILQKSGVVLFMACGSIYYCKGKGVSIETSTLDKGLTSYNMSIDIMATI